MSAPTLKRNAPLFWHVLRERLPENPFSTLELRRFVHRPTEKLAYLGTLWFALTVQLFFLRWLISNLPLRAISGRTLVILALIHLIFCGSAAATACTRRLKSAADAEALPDLLLPYRPHQWLWRQMSGGIYMGLLGWLLGFPFYVMAAFLKMASMSMVLSLYAQGLAIALLYPILSLIQHPALKTCCVEADIPPSQLRMTSILAGHSGVLPILLFLWWAVQPITSLVVIGQVIPPWVFCSLIAAILYRAALASSTLFLRANTPHLQHAHTTHLACLILLHGLTLFAVYSLIPHRLPLWIWIALAAAVPLIALGSGMIRIFRSRRRIPLSRGEQAIIRRLTERWSNPIFRRELSRRWRERRILSAWLVQITLITCLLIYFVWRIKSGSSLGKVNWSAFIGPFSQVFAFSIRSQVAREQAQKDWKDEALEQLFLTPLSSRQILGGRLAAMALHSTIIGLPLWLALLGGVAFFSPYLALASVGFILPIVISNYACEVWRPATTTHHHARQKRLLGMLQILFYAGIFILLIALSLNKKLLWVILALILHGGANFYFARRWFRLRVQDFDHLRTG